MGSGPGRRMPSGVLKGGTFEKRGRHSRVWSLALGCRFWRSTGISLILFRGHIFFNIFFFFVGYSIFPCGLEGFSLPSVNYFHPVYFLDRPEYGVILTIFFSRPEATMAVYWLAKQ